MSRYMKLKHTDDALHLRFFMPGVAKEDAKVYLDKSELVAEGVKEKDFEDDKDDYMLRFRIHLPMHHVKANAITTEMKNGALKVCVPLINAQLLQPCF
ncbi:heat shock 22 kDa protein mitochondrial [Phtheirospermum japonicum]|uniref:Heat shock 22 kDa protein mitochondrial n=1 Tax=Phtheirospermum japonicum TaxID=374723 RepID=A0A830BTK2_9LAMI|nr:heat shock 22 kDa protein mitochondrial [Phtheirospermum japonicum]